MVALSNLTNALDERLARALVDELGVTDAITLERYAEAYRICDNYDERRRQIQMIDAIGRGIDRRTRREARRPLHLQPGIDEHWLVTLRGALGDHCLLYTSRCV